jgi:TfoX/Sxy family transcriptional regulator of competence genes
MAQGSPEVVARFEELGEVVADADRKLVFGCPTRLVSGNMFFGVHRLGLFVRLPEDSGAELLALGGEPFEPMAGRPMSGFYVLPETVADQEQWVARSYAFARTLPPKEPKKPKGQVGKG